MMRLDVGAGPRSDCEYQVDIVKFPKTTHVFDAMVEPWQFNDNTFDEVRMEQFLEHVPTIEHIRDNFGRLEIIHPRIHCMKEAYRVLKPGGILHASVPAEIEQWAQDPTHTGPIILDGFFNYFCGEWGGNTPGEFVHDSYGINFAFKKIESRRDGFILTVRLMK